MVIVYFDELKRVRDVVSVFNYVIEGWRYGQEFFWVGGMMFVDRVEGQRIYFYGVLFILCWGFFSQFI